VVSTPLNLDYRYVSTMVAALAQLIVDIQSSVEKARTEAAAAKAANGANGVSNA